MRPSSILCLLCASLALATPAHALTGKIQIYGHRLDPTDQDARRFSRAAWGGGIEASFSSPAVGNLLAGTIGFEASNMLSKTTEYRDPDTQLRVEQQTNQTYFRAALGGRVGPNGHGFVRPHVGAHLALAVYDINTDVVIPDDSDRENEIRQHLKGETRSAFGYDLTTGIDWNFGDLIPVETGVRFIHSFNVPQQLGEGSVTIHPSYIQYYLGVGFNWHRLNDKKPKIRD